MWCSTRLSSRAYTFLIYINDMHYSSNKLQFFLFADDTNLLYADKNLKSLEKVVNKELEHVSDWLIANKLTLNIKSNLSWKAHIDYISLKISKTIGIISRLRYYLPLPILLNICRSLIYPYLTYGLVVWGQAAQMYLNKILVLQKRVLRITNFSTNREHAIPLFNYHL